MDKTTIVKVRRLNGDWFAVGQRIAIHREMKGEWLFGVIRAFELRERHEPLAHVIIFRLPKEAWPNKRKAVELMTEQMSIDISWLRGFFEARLEKMGEDSAVYARVVKESRKMRPSKKRS